MDSFYPNDKPFCECASKPEPSHQDCCQDIVCSEKHVAECEARLFCEVTERLRYEIKHARSQRELEQLIRIANHFLGASAQKEKAISAVVSSCQPDGMKPKEQTDRV